MEAALDTLSQSVLGALVVVLLGANVFLIKQLLRAKDEKITQVQQMADRLINQATSLQALVQENTTSLQALAHENTQNYGAMAALVKRTEKTVEAHAFSCPHVDTTKFVSIRGQGGT